MSQWFMLSRNKGSCIWGCIRMSMVAQTRGVILPLDAALVGTHTHGVCPYCVPVIGSLF